MKIILLIFFVISLQSSIFPQYVLSASVFGSGGGVVSNTNNNSSFTLGQSITGISANTNHILNSGFWYSASLITDVDDENTLIPFDFDLFQNYPNPFNPTTTIKYSLAEGSFVSIKVYDILGRLIVTLVNEERPIGYHQVQFNAVSLASGTYFYRMEAGDHVFVKKLIVLK
jgi:hypothetical protein